MDASSVALYLKQNPDFFEEYADVVADIFVPHPHGGHAIPIAERQIVTLREKNTDLENRLREMIRFGGENDQISERLHRSTLALIAAPDLETTLQICASFAGFARMPSERSFSRTAVITTCCRWLRAKSPASPFEP
jgi:hypothetical protein